MTSQKLPRGRRVHMAVDEDLYKIPPDLLHRKPSRVSQQNNSKRIFSLLSRSSVSCSHLSLSLSPLFYFVDSVSPCTLFGKIFSEGVALSVILILPYSALTPPLSFFLLRSPEKDDCLQAPVKLPRSELRPVRLSGSTESGRLTYHDLTDQRLPESVIIRNFYI